MPSKIQLSQLSSVTLGHQYSSKKQKINEIRFFCNPMCKITWLKNVTKCIDFPFFLALKACENCMSRCFFYTLRT